jgi:hypothetical protein
LFLTRWLLPNRVHGLVQDEVQGVTRLRFTLRGEVCTAACKVGCASNARGCRFRLRRECAPDVRTSKLRIVLVAAEVIALWRRSGDGRAVRTHAALAMDGEPYIPVCPSAGFRNKASGRIVESTSSWAS